MTPFTAPAGRSAAGGVGGGLSPLHRQAETYLSGLEISQGALAGQPFRVLPWQKRFLRGALRPGVYESALTMARGGGKSTFIAGLACAALNGPLSQPNSEVIVVAASLAQARIIFRHCLRFLDDGIAAKHYRVWDGPSRSALLNRKNGVLLELKGARPQTLHGLAPSIIVADEMAQWPANMVDALLSALDTSLGKIPGGRFWKIGTRPASETHPFSVALRDADYIQLHAARPDDPPFQKRTWTRACPSLPFMPDLEAKIRAEAQRAKTSPEMLASFRALRLNLGTSDTVQNLLIELETWKRIEGDAAADGKPIWGIDLGTTSASSCVSAFYPQTGRLDVVAAFPDAISLAERGLRDGVGKLYVDQHKRGELILTPGFACSVPLLLREALNRFGRPAAVCSDRWREGELRDGLKAAGVPSSALSLRGQGFRDGGEDVRQFRRAVAERRVVPVESLVFRSAFAEAKTVTDPAGNAKLSKGSEGGRRTRARDDAAAAAILAVAEGVRRGRQPVRRRRVAVAR